MSVEMSTYPVELEERTRLAEGVEIFLRPIRREDGPLLQDLLNHMSLEDRQLRFFASILQVPEMFVRELAQIDYKTRIALLVFSADTDTILGAVQLAAEPDGNRAEFGVAVRSDWHGRGLGWLLMHRMPALAARLGVAEVFGYVLRTNKAMLDLCRKMGFTVEAAPGEADAVLVRLRVAPESERKSYT